MADSFGCSVLTGVVGISDKIIPKTYDSIMGSWPGLTITAIYVAVVGYMVIMGRTGDRAKSWAVSALLLATMSGFAGSYSAFHNWIGDPLLSSAEAIASLGATAGGASEGGVCGAINAQEEGLGYVLGAIDEMDLPGNFLTDAWLYIKAGIVVAIFTVLACLTELVMVALSSLALFSVAVISVAAGPCLWFASFKETRFITGAWFRSMVNYCLWYAFIGIAAGISSHFMTAIGDHLRSWDIESQGVFTGDVGLAMLICALCIYMMLKTADWAAALSGGSSMQTGIIGAAGQAMGSAAGSGINGAGSLLGSGLAAGAKAVPWGAMGSAAMSGAAMAGRGAMAGAEMAGRGAMALGQLGAQGAMRAYSALKGMLPRR